MPTTTLSSAVFKRFFLLWILAGFSLGTATAQTSEVDFESIYHEFTTFGGSTFQRIQDPAQAGNTVGELVNAGGVWEGIYMDLPSKVLLDSIKVIQMQVWNPGGTSHSMICKLEDGQQQDVEVQVNFQSAGWQTLTFDFSQARISGSATPINAAGAYQRMALFIDGGSAVAGTYAIDDIIYPDFSSVYVLDVLYDQLVWSDEFNYNGPVDPQDWFQEVVPPNSWGWHNGEFQHYTNRTDNSFVSNGMLNIVAKRETYTAYGITKNFTSARLNSNYSFTYGRIDVRAKLPFGDGTWPAIWMLGTSIGNNVHPFSMPWPDCGEIDIMEHWGYEQDRIHGSIHTLSSHGSTVNTGSTIQPHVSDSFHVYSVNWSPDRISFLLDDKIFYVYRPNVKNAATWPFDDPQFIILNIAMGGAWFDVDPAFTQSDMQIDYVRVYQDSAATVGQIEPVQHARLRLFPQPAQNELYIEGISIQQLQLVDALGRLVMQEVGSGEPSIRVSVSELPAGLYGYRILNGGEWQSGKLLIGQ